MYEKTILFASPRDQRNKMENDNRFTQALETTIDEADALRTQLEGIGLSDGLVEIITVAFHNGVRAATQNNPKTRETK